MLSSHLKWSCHLYLVAWWPFSWDLSCGGQIHDGWVNTKLCSFCFGRSAKHLTSHVSGTPPWRCLAVQSSSGTNPTVLDGARGMRAQRDPGRMSVTTTPCCTPCLSWPSSLETCWCVWLCWGSDPSRRPPTIWWWAWLWPTSWWHRWSCRGPCTWRWGRQSIYLEHWSIPFFDF